MTSTSQSESKYLRNIIVAVLVICFALFAGGILVTEALQGNLSGGIEKDSTSILPVPEIIDGKDAETGLIAAEGYLTVKQNCTNCHSGKLITQNHLSRDRWETTIRWMQKNQNLGDLGENEPIILDYLATNYGPQNTGRRKPLEQPVWYPLK